MYDRVLILHPYHTLDGTFLVESIQLTLSYIAPVTLIYCGQPT